MEWLIAVMTWNGTYANLLIQKDDETLFKLTVDRIDPDTITKAIATQFNIPIERVIYHDTRQTLYRRLTYMRFVVME
jgi:hypothetical protein